MLFLIVGADAFWICSRQQISGGTIWQIQKISTTGVRDAGEYVENSDGTWEVHKLLHAETRGVSEAQVLIPQGLGDEFMDGGVSRSSDEMG